MQFHQSKRREESLYDFIGSEMKHHRLFQLTLISISLRALWLNAIRYLISSSNYSAHKIANSSWTEWWRQPISHTFLNFLFPDPTSRLPNIGRTLKPQRMASDNRWWPTLILLLLFPIQKLVNKERFSVVSLYNIQPPTLIANILHNQWAINGGKRGKSNSWRCAIDTTTT